MKGSKFTETQIIRILKEVEGDRTVKEICREYGMSDAKHYNWKAKYDGMTASNIKRLKELKQGNRRLNHMYANMIKEETFTQPYSSFCRFLKVSKGWTMVRN